jgi:hypothetical protein
MSAEFPEPLDLNFYPHKHPRVLIEMRELIATDVDGELSHLTVQQLTEAIHAADCEFWGVLWRVDDDGNVLRRRHDQA